MQHYSPLFNGKTQPCECLPVKLDATLDAEVLFLNLKAMEHTKEDTNSPPF